MYSGSFPFIKFLYLLFLELIILLTISFYIIVSFLLYFILTATKYKKYNSPALYISTYITLLFFIFFLFQCYPCFVLFFSFFSSQSSTTNQKSFFATQNLVYFQTGTFQHPTTFCPVF